MLHVRTPLLSSESMSRSAGVEVQLKLEAAQPTGSFKIRGIGHLWQRASERGVRALVSSSGGNAGLAVAYAGARLGIPVTVVVPATTTARMRDLIADRGAEVIVHGEVWDEAHEHATSLVVDEKVLYVHPFDHPTLWDGHSTLVEELAAEIDEPSWIVVAVGGGGLLGGVLVGLDRVGWGETKILAVETEGAASFARSVRAGEVVTIDRIDSVAKSLGARRVSDGVLARALERGVTCELVSDALAVDGAVRFRDEHGHLVEPACGAALAAAYDWRYGAAAAPIVVVACGGVGITDSELERLRLQCSRP